MKFIQTPLPGVIVIEPDVFRDERGFFLETWHRQKFTDGGIDTKFVQDNHSRSSKNTLRGLHYQVQQSQGKLIRVTEGWIYDVVVDLRKTSNTFGQWYGHSLSEENMNMLWCPPGFAHGFLVTSDYADVCYKCTDYYAPEYERALLWNDLSVGINWPLDEGTEPILSEKDQNGKSINEAEVFP
ncbi:MAG: dTDP-4-dehydrorhamnose 3,5-epimerase [Gammaproteobacteria bacterium]|jgi:dTDP-4-dehydrorhamnose 3,5-epimerase